MALETLNNRYGIRHFDEGGSTSAPGFDAGYYMAANPDVAQNWGGDAYSHYVAHGQSEGRAPSAPEAPSGALNIASPDFNVQQFLGSNYTAPTPATAADISGLYQSTFNRAADQPGLDYWTQQANLGVPLSAIQQAFYASPEYQSMSNPAPTGGGGLSSVTVTGAGPEFNNVAAQVNNTPSFTDSQVAAYIKDHNLSGVGLTNAMDAFGINAQQLANAQNLIKANDPSIAGSSAAYQQSIAGNPNAHKENLEFYNPATVSAINDWYQTNLGREADPEGLEYWRKSFGSSLDPNEITQLQAAPEYTNRQTIIGDYKNYLGRDPDAPGLKYYQDQLAAGKSLQDIQKQIALSNESITANTPSVKANLEATLGKDIVASLTPEQLAEYTKTILDPMRPGTKMPVGQDQFDANFYLQNNKDVAALGLDPYQHYLEYGINEGRAGNAKAPAYLTQAENLLEVYKNIALDPVLGAKLKTENPELWEKVTPLTRRPDEVIRTERIHAGDFGTFMIEGVKVPILNGKAVDNLLGRDGFGTITDFSHHRGNLTRDLGWSSNSSSNKLARGAEAIGVTATPYTDEFGKTTYQYQGLDDAAKLVGIDPSKFQDKQIQATTKDQYDSDGQLVQKAGEPAFQIDEYGNRTPVMETLSRDQQLYDAVNQSAKDIYLYTGDSLTPGKAREGGAESFNTVIYKRSGDELIPITKPTTHGGVQNMDIYRPKDYGFSYYAQGPMFVGSMALAAATAGGSFAATGGLAATVGSAVGLTGTAAVIGGGVIVGATMGALNAAAADKDAGKGALSGAVVGGITSAMQPLMNAGAMKDAISTISDASGGFYTSQQIGSIIATTLATTVGSAMNGANGDQIFKAFASSLAANGISQGAVSTVTAALKDSGITPDAMAKIARATQLAGSTVATSALSGKNQEQIMNNLISQFTDPSKLTSNVMNVATTKGTPPKIEPTNPFGTENVGMTSGSVDNVLQSQIMDGIANNSDDPIAFMNAAKNWTGNGSENVAFVTTEMVKQGMPADQIAADLQQLYRIPADKANEYAQYMASKGGTKTTPITAATTTQQPTNVVAQTSVAAPQPQLYDTLVDMFKNPEPLGPAIATLAQALPSSRYDVGYSSSGLTSGTTQGNLGGADPANDPRTTRAQSPRVGGDEYSNVYPSVTGRAAQDPNYIRELVEAYKADPGYAPIREELQKLDPRNAVFSNAQNAEVERTQAPATNAAPPLYAGKQVTITGYPELSALPKPVEAPTPMAPEPRPEPMPAVPSPNKPANDPFIIPEPRVPGRPITPIMPVSPPGAIPKIAPGSLPLTSPSIVPTPGIQPISPTPPATPTTPTTTPLSPTAPTQQPSGEPKSAPTPEQQTAIQQVAKTQQDAQRLEIAVPRATQLINQGMPRPVVIPKVAAETGVSVQDLATVINATVPEVTVPTPSVTAPTVTTPTPAPKTPAPKTPTTATRNAGVISPFLIQQYGGIQDLSPGLTGGGNYSLSGIPSTDTNMNPMTPNFPLQQFASTSPPSPLELGAQQQPNEPIQMADGGSTTQKAYNPYDVSSGISGSLTPGLTKARLDYLLTGLPQSKAEGGSIEGHNPQFFSEGGLGSMENTFVEGDGDGTSDQVPAMLANGEFVIPADVVSGLGNGSNDAGAEVLQEFLKAIREHKHSAKADKLPPESKGPLAYLTNAKRKVKVA